VRAAGDPPLRVAELDPALLPIILRESGYLQTGLQLCDPKIVKIVTPYGRDVKFAKIV
jgi:hypothetical protein